MERLPTELEGVTILRNLETRRRAEELLSGPSRPKLAVGYLFVVAATLVAQYSFQGLNAPVIASAILVMMSTGLVLLAMELWFVRRRLEAVIELVNLGHHQQA